MNYLFILGVALIIFGIIFVIIYLRERCGKYSIIKGRIADEIRTVSLRGSSRRPFIGYVLIIEYQYNSKTVRVEHRIETPRPSRKYKVNDRVELRVYKDKPDKAILNDRLNILLPAIIGIPCIIIGIVMCVIWACLR